MNCTEYWKNDWQKNLSKNKIKLIKTNHHSQHVDEVHKEFFDILNFNIKNNKWSKEPNLEWISWIGELSAAQNNRTNHNKQENILINTILINSISSKCIKKLKGPHVEFFVLIWLIFLSTHVNELTKWALKNNCIDFSDKNNHSKPDIKIFNEYYEITGATKIARFNNYESFWKDNVASQDQKIINDIKNNPNHKKFGHKNATELIYPDQMSILQYKEIWKRILKKNERNYEIEKGTILNLCVFTDKFDLYLNITIPGIKWLIQENYDELKNILNKFSNIYILGEEWAIHPYFLKGKNINPIAKAIIIRLNKDTIQKMKNWTIKNFKNNTNKHYFFKMLHSDQILNIYKKSFYYNKKNI